MRIIDRKCKSSLDKERLFPVNTNCMQISQIKTYRSPSIENQFHTSDEYFITKLLFSVF